MRGITASLAFGLSVCLLPSAKGQLKFKGHAVGETVEQFAATEPVDLQRTSCTPGEVKCLMSLSSIRRLRAGSGTYFRDDALPVQFMFSDGALYEISARLPNPDYERAASELTARLESEPKTTTTVLQNAAGAQWQDRTASWHGKGLHVTLYESNDPARPSLRLLLLIKSILMSRRRRRSKRGAR